LKIREIKRRRDKTLQIRKSLGSPNRKKNRPELKEEYTRGKKVAIVCGRFARKEGTGYRRIGSKVEKKSTGPGTLKRKRGKKKKLKRRFFGRNRKRRLICHCYCYGKESATRRGGKRDDEQGSRKETGTNLWTVTSVERVDCERGMQAKKKERKEY